jgi:urease gamma subunit
MLESQIAMKLSMAADEIQERKLQRLETENRRLWAVAEMAKDALSLLRCEKKFSEDLCIRVGNVVRYERVVQGLEQTLAALEVEGGSRDGIR